MLVDRDKTKDEYLVWIISGYDYYNWLNKEHLVEMI